MNRDDPAPWAAAPAPAPAAALDAASRPRLLVVDDQAANIQLLYQAFRADHQVLMATSGEQALAACIDKQPDLVLLDVVMPGMDGYQVCEHLKANEATRDIPVIFVTAHDDVAAETRGLELGAVDFIAKPINPAIVRVRVRTHLTLKRQSDLLRQWATIDGLTGVGNRRHFDERLAVEWARALRQGSSLSLVMVDVDQFKLFNDEYGHQAGDDCLRRVAGALKLRLKRPADLLARYGGEEFVCLLPDTDMPGVQALAWQMCQDVQSLAIAHSASPVASHVTVSVGVCVKPPGAASSAAELLRGADVQLYRAKSRGRNQACVAELTGPA
jgi:diguanylate cyclase (GGDEF)-like protein